MTGATLAPCVVMNRQVSTDAREHWPPAPLTETDVAELMDLYDDEIVYFDAMFNDFVSGLDTSGALDRSVLTNRLRSRCSACSSQ